MDYAHTVEILGAENREVLTALWCLLLAWKWAGNPMVFSAVPDILYRVQQLVYK